MRALTHQVVGVGLAAVPVAAADRSGTTAAALLGAAWIGSLLPDADLAGARVYRRTRIERHAPALSLPGAIVRLPARLLTLLPHRGVTHSLPACVLAVALAGVLVGPLGPALGPTAAAGLAIGYGAHIAADACTPSGVPLWAPFSRRRRWLLPPAPASRPAAPANTPPSRSSARCSS